jgi:hypothetical protein
MTSASQTDVAPGDQRFLMIRTMSSGRARNRLILVPNFIKELESKLGAKK